MGRGQAEERPAAAPGELPDLPPAPPIDPNIQFALAHLLQALVRTPSENANYSGGMEGSKIAADAGESEPVDRKAKRRRSLPEPLPPDEADALRKAPRMSGPIRLRDRCMVELLLGAGLRISELCNLEPRDVTIEGTRGQVRVIKGKGDKDRVAYFNATVSGPLLEEWKRERKRLGLSGSRYLFCTVKGGVSPQGKRHISGNRVSPRQFQKTLKLFARDAGIAGWDESRRVCPHKLRHTHATEMLEGGVNIRAIQRQLGHEHLTTTELYTHVVDTTRKRQITGVKDRLDPPQNA